MKNCEDSDKLEKKLKRVEMVLNFVFILLMLFLLDLFENLLSMNKLWMQLIFVAVYSIIWSRVSGLILQIIRNRIEAKRNRE
ncbi:MAG: hypothetical protein LIP10_00140 [Clostridiales bacterium]|nr:hypothetical protein [Clostridiales bacterium]